MVYRLIMFYLVRSEASYQSFTGSTYGLVCFYNKCALIIKVAPKVHSDGIITPANFATPKIHCIPHKVKHIFSNKSIAVFTVEIAYLFHRIAVQSTPPKFGPHSVKLEFTI